jgi:hypothetical protein
MKIKQHHQNHLNNKIKILNKTNSKITTTNNSNNDQRLIVVLLEQANT